MKKKGLILMMLILILRIPVLWCLFLYFELRCHKYHVTVEIQQLHPLDDSSFRSGGPYHMETSPLIYKLEVKIKSQLRFLFMFVLNMFTLHFFTKTINVACKA